MAEYDRHFFEEEVWRYWKENDYKDMDDDERKRILGVFKNNPQKIRILPGLEDVFEKFLNHLRKLKGLNQTGNNNLRGTTQKQRQ